MSSHNAPAQARLFRFSVPGLDAALAAPLEQMMGVARLAFVTRVPCTPPAILGLTRWQDSPAVVIDLRRILDPAAEPAAAGDYVDYHHMVARVAVENRIGLVAWPIRAGGQIINAPLMVPGADPPSGLASEAVHRTVLIDSTPTLLVNMLRLPELAGSLYPVG